MTADETPRPGDRVQAGQFIGKVGESGSRPHAFPPFPQPTLPPGMGERINASVQSALRALSDPIAAERRMRMARSTGIGALLPPVVNERPMTFDDALAEPEADPEMATLLLRAERRGAARERVRRYLLDRDGFYGREMLDDDVIDEQDGSLLLLSDLRILAEVETYTDDEGFPASRPMETR